MAQDIHAFEVIVPAGTTKTAGFSVQLAMPPRIVREVEIHVPPGPRGEVGFALGASGVPVIPSRSGTWIVSDDEEISWPVEGYISSGGWQLFAYNTGQFPHTLYLRFLCDVVQSAGVETAPADLTGMTGSFLPAPGSNSGDAGQPLPTVPPVTPPVTPPVLPPTVPPPDFPPLPPLPPITVPPLPPITLPPLPSLNLPGATSGPPTYPQALEPAFAAQIIVALIFGRGMGADTYNAIAADVAQLGELQALYKWAAVGLANGEIALLSRVPALQVDHAHRALHVHSRAQVS